MNETGNIRKPAAKAVIRRTARSGLLLTPPVHIPIPGLTARHLLPCRSHAASNLKSASEGRHLEVSTLLLHSD